jgi:hypothetical protein
MKTKLVKNLFFTGLLSISVFLTFSSLKADEIQGKVPGYNMTNDGTCCWCEFTGNVWQYCEIIDQCCKGYHPGCELSPCWNTE